MNQTLCVHRKFFPIFHVFMFNCCFFFSLELLFKKVMKKFEICVLLRHYWKQSFDATAATKKVCEDDGDNLVQDRTTRNWFKRFNDGETDNTLAGQPTTVDTEATYQPINTCLQIIGRTRYSSSKMQWYGFVKVNKRCREVSHELTKIQAQRSCRKLAGKSP